MLTDLLVADFRVESFWWALLGGLVISLVNFFFGGEVKVKTATNRTPREEKKDPPRRPPEGKGPVIDI